MTKIILIEGLDGVGKTTLALEISKHFHAYYIPMMSPEVKNIREKLFNEWNGARHSIDLVYLASIYFQSHLIECFKKKFSYIVLDRYLLSYLAYNPFDLSELKIKEIMSTLNHVDITFILTSPHSTRIKRLMTRPIQESSKNQPIPVSKINSKFQEYISFDFFGKTLIIDKDLSIEDTKNIVINHIKKELT